MEIKLRWKNVVLLNVESNRYSLKQKLSNFGKLNSDVFELPKKDAKLIDENANNVEK